MRQDEEQYDAFGNFYPRAQGMFQQQVSRGGISMPIDKTSNFNAFSALFANARTPDEQARVRRDYASSLLSGDETARADDRSRFDARLGLMRGMIDRKPPDFFAGAPGAFGPADRGEKLSVGVHAGMGKPRRGGWSGGWDGEQLGLVPETRNFLLRYLRPEG